MWKGSSYYVFFWKLLLLIYCNLFGGIGFVSVWNSINSWTLHTQMQWNALWLQLRGSFVLDILSDVCISLKADWITSLLFFHAISANMCWSLVVYASKNFVHPFSLFELNRSGLLLYIKLLCLRYCKQLMSHYMVIHL